MLNKSSALKTVKQYGVNYDKIWIFDKIHHEINQFCSKHTMRDVYIDKFEMLDEVQPLPISRTEGQADCSLPAPNPSTPSLLQGLLIHDYHLEPH